MTIPTTRIGQLRVGGLASARPGGICYLRRNGDLLTYVAFGEGGVATQLLAQVALGELRSYPVPANSPNALHLDGADRFRIDIGAESADERQLDSYIGCLGAHAGGFLICAGVPDAFRNRIPAYFSLQTWAPALLEGQAFLETVWFTNWTLSYLDDSERPLRILGSPQWPDAQRLR